MEIYKAKDTNKAFAEMTGKNIDSWKTDWIDTIKQHVGPKGAP